MHIDLLQITYQYDYFHYFHYYSLLFVYFIIIYYFDRNIPINLIFLVVNTNYFYVGLFMSLKSLIINQLQLQVLIVFCIYNVYRNFLLNGKYKVLLILYFEQLCV